MDTRTEDCSDIRRRLAADPHRPLYHFIAPANWMNDPNGPMHFGGRHHLFYQHNPVEPVARNMHWGHAVSDDLVRWKDLPPALAPAPGGPDGSGCWSGSAVDNRGVPSLLYTGVQPECQCLAEAECPDDPDLARWSKSPANPVIPCPPDGLAVTGFRDPCAWREGNEWRLLLGSGIEGKGGAVLLYGSSDLVRWEYLGPALVGDAAAREPVRTGTMWECPQIFPVRSPSGVEKHCLVISALQGGGNGFARTVCFVGRFDGRRFEPERVDHLDVGNSYYAPARELDQTGRVLLWGWLREERAREAQMRAGWSGALSLPRVVSLGDDGRLRVGPAPEVEGLRGAHRAFGSVAAEPGRSNHLEGLSGNCIEIDAVFDPGGADAFGLRVRASPGGEEETLLVCDVAEGEIAIERERSSLDECAARSSFAGAFEQCEPGRVRMRAFVDRSAVELYVDGRATATARVYPARAESVGVDVFARGGRATLVSLDAWQMEPVWPSSR